MTKQNSKFGGKVLITKEKFLLFDTELSINILTLFTLCVYGDG
jgi:hypothetical protein